MLKISQSKAKGALLVALLLATISSCASQEADGLPGLPESEAALLDDGDAADVTAELPADAQATIEAAEATAPGSDASASPDLLADLKPNQDVMNNLEVSGDGLASEPSSEIEAAANLAPAVAPVAAVASAGEAGDSDQPFYNPIGGESLGRVAYELYGKRARQKALREENPALEGVEKLSAEQKVYFRFDRLHPQAKLLTKDLISRYPTQLGEKIAAATEQEEKITVTLAKGETLQDLSRRLYGTTRLWTEIYLLNQDRIANFDKVKPGTELRVVKRDAIPAATVASVPAKAPEATVPAKTAPTKVRREKAPAPMPVVEPVREVKEEPVAPAPVAPEPVVPAPAPAAPAPVAAAPMPVVDPIPETSPAAPAPVIPISPPANPFADAAKTEAEKGPAFSAASFFANAANVRRLIYVMAILVIGVSAFFLTRTNKKKSFDMLDVTTNDLAPRPKLKGQHDDQNVG